MAWARLKPPPNRIRISKGALRAVGKSRREVLLSVPAGMAQSAITPAMAMPVSLMAMPVRCAMSGLRIQAATTARKTKATRFSGTLIGPIAFSMSATTCCSVAASVAENGKARRVRMKKAATSRDRYGNADRHPLGEAHLDVESLPR